MIRRNIILPVIAITVVGATLFGTSQMVNAQTTGNSMSTLVEMIAQKFNLDQKQVQIVVDQFKVQKQTSLQEKTQQQTNIRLDQAISQGKITAAQKQAILDEITKLRSEYNPQSIKNMTAEQRKQTKQKEQAEIATWTKTQGIDAMYLQPKFGIRSRHEGWMKTAPTLTPTPKV